MPTPLGVDSPCAQLERGRLSARLRQQLTLRWLLTSLTLFNVGLWGAQASAQTSLNLPEPLKPWLSWVQEELPDPPCVQRTDLPRVSDTQVDGPCVWASALELELIEGGARFTLRAHLDRPALLPLPYASSSWPLDLELKGADQRWRPHPLIKHQDTPKVSLPKGEIELRAHLLWGAQPDWLQLPLEVGLTSLKGQGVSGEWVERDAEGRLWLRTQQDSPSEAEVVGDALYAQVYRAFYDEVPMRVETHLQLNTSGQPREVTLTGVELEGSQLVQLNSELTSERLEDGLRVYLKPGRATIKLTSLINAPVKELKVPRLEGAESPAQEVWVWHSQEKLRSVQLDGLTSVDADQTSLPSELKGGRYTLLAAPDERLSLQELKRGVKQPPPNQLSLTRTLWLDLDGEGFVSRDHLTGSLNREGRLHYKHPGRLGSAQLSSGGQTDPLLITRDPVSQREGVEVRAQSLDLTAHVRHATARQTFEAVGWDHIIHNLSLSLNLPPGWLLLTVDGASSASGAWLHSWEMIDFFFILLICVATARTLGPLSAAIAFALLVLSHQERLAPHWLWLHLLVSGALLKLISTGVLHKLIRGYALVTIITTTGFLFAMVHSDARFTLHPHLKAPSQSHYSSNTMFKRPSSREDFQYELGASYGRNANIQQRAKKSWGKGAYQQKLQAQNLNQVDPNAVVQTGPGVPSWSWRSHRVSFSGPVSPEQRVSIRLLTPKQNRALHALRALLSLALFGLLLSWLWRSYQEGQAQQEGGDDEPKGGGLSGGATSLALALALCSPLLWLSAPVSAQPVFEPQTQTSQAPFQLQEQAQEQDQALTQAQPASVQHHAATSVPSSELLTELKERLLRERRSARCEGSCLYLSLFELTVNELNVTLKARLNAERDTFMVLPGAMQRLLWREVLINGRAAPTRGELRGEELALLVRVPQGVHELSATGLLTDLERLTLAMYDRPQQLSLDLKGWSIDGEGDKVEGSLELLRQRAPALSTAQAGTTAHAAPDEPNKQAPPSAQGVQRDLSWFSVRRHLVVGLPWQVETTISRPFSSAQSAQSFSLPLLEGERLLSPEVTLSAEGARVSFGEGVREVSFVSELTPRNTLTLIAPESSRWSETWELTCGAIWQCHWQGLNPNSSNKGVSGAMWSPWPRERLELSFARPQGVEGATSTVQEATVEVRPGDQLLSGEAQLLINASRGGARQLTLPQGASQVRLFANSEEQLDPLKDGQVRLPLEPGKNSLKVTWTQPWESKRKVSLPQLKLDGEIVNLNLKIHKPRELWLLWASGPDWGPVVLFWSYLLFAALLAFGFGRARLAPLSSVAWFLFLLGFTQVSIPSLILVVAWFATLEARGRLAHRLPRLLFNLTQLALIPFTLLFLGSLFNAVQRNLLGDVSVQVTGAGSYESLLRWYVDRTDGLTPLATIYTLPLWVWQALMLLWALWLANSLIMWAKWAWAQANQGGLWRSKQPVDTEKKGTVEARAPQK